MISAASRRSLLGPSAATVGGALAGATTATFGLGKGERTTDTGDEQA